MTATDSNYTRDGSFSAWNQDVNSDGYAGIMSWQEEINTPRDTNYGFTFNSSTAGIIQTEANLMRAQNGSVLYNFEGTTDGWQQSGLLDGPWSVSDWAALGNDSLKSDISLGGSQGYLYIDGPFNFTGDTSLSAVVTNAPWGSLGSGIQAKIYVKTGSTWQWYDGGLVPITAPDLGTVLTLNLANVSNLNDVNEIGIQFITPTNSSGQSAVYVDDVEVQ